MSRLQATLAFALAGATALGGCRDRRNNDRARAQPVVVDASASDHAATSNVLATDYVGPEACGECHAAQYRGWSDNLHRTMNQLATVPTAVVGDFGGSPVRYAGGTARMTRSGDDYYMELAAAGGNQPALYRVTRTIGTRYLQEYVGVQVDEIDGEVRSAELRLPFGFWLRDRRWFHQQYFDSWYGAEYQTDAAGVPTDAPAGDPFAVDRAPWATRCAWCHNTYPFEFRLARAGAKQKLGSGPEQFFRLDGADARASITERNELPTRELVTVGISCESCHFGGRAHAAGAALSFGPAGPHAVSIRDPFPGRRDHAMTINSICAQCHSAPSPTFDSGTATRNSREALEFIAGSCSSAAKCSDCHDPHTKEPPAGSPERRTREADMVGTCVGCHPEQADTAKHAGHRAADASCLDCHMPRIVQGISTIVRTHRISTPAREQIATDSQPNACNLCHVGESRRWAYEHVERPPSPAPVELNLPATPAGLDWLVSDHTPTRIVAADAIARSPARARYIDSLLGALDDPVAHTRMRLLFALEAAIGRPITTREYDPTLPPSARRAQLRRLSRVRLRRR